MKPDDLAFMRAYSRNVGGAEPHIVQLFLEMQNDHDAFYDLYSEYYSSLADAYGVWLDALHYALTQQLEAIS